LNNVWPEGKKRAVRWGQSWKNRGKILKMKKRAQKRGSTKCFQKKRLYKIPRGEAGEGGGGVAEEPDPWRVFKDGGTGRI